MKVRIKKAFNPLEVEEVEVESKFDVGQKVFVLRYDLKSHPCISEAKIEKVYGRFDYIVYELIIKENEDREIYDFRVPFYEEDDSIFSTFQEAKDFLMEKVKNLKENSK